MVSELFLTAQYIKEVWVMVSLALQSVRDFSQLRAGGNERQDGACKARAGDSGCFRDHDSAPDEDSPRLRNDPVAAEP